MQKLELTWEDADKLAEALARRQEDAGWLAVHGIPQGGLPVAAMVARVLRLPIVWDPALVDDRTLVVDDLVGTGMTAERYTCGGFDALIRKPHSPQDVAPDAHYVDAWVVFPWENGAAGPEDAVVRLLEFMGEAPQRDGLRDTPRRVVKALGEMTEGYAVDPGEVLSTTFDVSHDQMVVVSGIEFTSLCEHHMLPFTGTATVAYIPGDRVVGLSKLARLVECYARRLQVQERMTDQIAGAIEEHLRPAGTGVVLAAQHSCMACRGIRKRGLMVTSALHGALRLDPAARAEFMALARARS